VNIREAVNLAIDRLSRNWKQFVKTLTAASYSREEGKRILMFDLRNMNFEATGVLLSYNFSERMHAR